MFNQETHYLPGTHAPDVEDTVRSVAVGIAFGQNDPAIDYNGTVPMTRATRQGRESGTCARVVDVQSTLLRIDEEEPVRHERARPRGIVAPYFVQTIITQLPSRSPPVIRRKHPGCSAILPNRRLGEQVRAAGRGDNLQFLPLVRGTTRDGPATKQADLAVLAALGQQITSQHDG